MTYIVLFDGDCQLCQRSVQFIIKRDPQMKFKFASLQSVAGEQLLDRCHHSHDLTSLVLVKQNRCYTKSSAALHICKSLTGIWKIGGLFLIIPRPIRDYIYNIIAKNRHHLMSQRKSCQVPTPEDRQRLL